MYMKLVQINAVSGQGSTGKIAESISNILDNEGIENYILYAIGASKHKNAIKYMHNFEVKINALISKIFGICGFTSVGVTLRLIKKLKKISPDIVHIHNIHSHNVNLGLLFKYLKKNNIKIVWTFHDCWAFTGYCMYFDYVGCDKWKAGCNNCPQAKTFSWVFDKSSWLYNKKKKLFSNLNMIVVTPSKWLKGLVEQSFLSEYPVKVINNGIDLNIFKPTQSDFRQKYNIEDKFVILDVAFGFEKRKGLDYYIELSKRIDKNCVIVLVGLSKAQIDCLPENIIGIERTANQTELAGIYTQADVFVNCTLEDNYPTVNLEAVACSTPVITFDTGGSKESAGVEFGCSVSVEQKNIDMLFSSIEKLRKNNISSQLCLKVASENFEDKKSFQKYIDLYNTMIG